MASQPPASVAPLDAQLATLQAQLATLQAQLATLQAQLLSMLGPQPPSEAPPPHLLSWRCRPSPVAPKAKAVPAPQAPEGDLAAKLAKRRRKD